MICTNCGTPIPDDSKFCPTCGTPVPQQPVQPAAPEAPAWNPPPAQPEAPAWNPPPAQPEAPAWNPPPAQPEAPAWNAAPEQPAAPPPPPPPPPAPPAPPRAPGERLVAVNLAPSKLTSIFRIVCLVLAGLFLIFSIFDLYVIIRSISISIRSLIYYGSSSMTYIIIYNLLLAGAAITACVFLAIGAASWKPTYGKKLLLGLAIATSIRVLAALIHFIHNIVVYASGGFFTYFFTVMPRGLLYTMGYAASVVVVYFFMNQLNCAPFALGRKQPKNNSAPRM